MTITFLHIKIAPKLNQSLNLMKYSINHSWKFESWFSAFMCGLFQLIVLVGLEFCNIVLRLSDTTLVLVAMNFIDVLIISDFGEYYFGAAGDEQLSKLISTGNIVLDPAAPLTLKALLEIEITTSEEARLMNDKHRLSSVPLA